ncbi:FtsW/RodA/SpoVE family cell cycle protein [Streptococcus entericus]|uniref:FtsW/RodA/SpoVE family cell cycle protein n=1 Tax=Streptococcus entericus TaxID=155680 RepID=UPI00037D5CA8|nr:FtsW/RodA/SpoVE family cell cycle protein [Streptococcus entericus]
MFKTISSIERHIDYVLLLPVFFLLLTGFFSVFIATSHDYPDRVGIVMIQQLAWTAIGLLMALVVMLFSKSFLWKVSPLLYVLGLGLMVLPLIYFDAGLVSSTGAKNWVTLGGATLFQPSEFMKITYILILAVVTVWYQEQFPQVSIARDLKLLGLYGLLTVPVFILLGLQKDLGTSLVFLAILSGIILLSGVSWRLILPVVGGFAAGIAGFLWVFTQSWGKDFFFNLGMDTYQINRISAWLDPFAYAEGISYQQTQSMIAIGSGGLTGKGFNVIDLNIPVRESDMIFTVIAENFGFIGSSLLLILYLLLIYRMLKITLVSNNRFYVYISSGFIMMILFHIFENIGAAIGLLPLTGIPLPFISQGGSSLVTNLIGVGLVLSMSFQQSLEQEQRLS